MQTGKRYQQLSYEERVKIEVLQAEGKSLRSIAKALGRSPNTVSVEMREKKVKGAYAPKKAQHKTYWRRHRSKRGCMKVAMSPELTKMVKEKLLLKWSPERIAGYARKGGTPLSKKAVYKFIRSRCMERYLFWQRHPKRRGKRRAHESHRDLEKRTIEARPPVLGSGHVEVDFIVSRQSSAVLLVVVDRHTRFTTVKRLASKTHAGVLTALGEIRTRQPMTTITTDNDIVFRKWQEMEDALAMPFFFTLPYHSWEKGLVENTNRWIRCFVSKKRDLATVSDDELRSIETFLNDTPRQCLGYLTASELLFTHVS